VRHGNRGASLHFRDSRRAGEPAAQRTARLVFARQFLATRDVEGCASGGGLSRQHAALAANREKNHFLSGDSERARQPFGAGPGFTPAQSAHGGAHSRSHRRLKSHGTMRRARRFRCTARGRRQAVPRVCCGLAWLPLGPSSGSHSLVGLGYCPCSRWLDESCSASRRRTRAVSQPAKKPDSLPLIASFLAKWFSTCFRPRRNSFSPAWILPS